MEDDELEGGWVGPGEEFLSGILCVSHSGPIRLVTLSHRVHIK